MRLVPADYLVLGLVICLGIVIRAYFDFGLLKVDPFTYADAAGSIARGEPVYDSDVTGSVYYTQYIRLSLILPAALLYRVFGVSDAASIAWPFALSLGMAAMAYIAGRILSGRLAGVVAAGAVCFFPLNVINSTQFLPDIVLAAFGSLATVCFVAATDTTTTTRGQRFWLYLGVGAALALACYARATAVSLLPGMALMLVARRRVGPDVLGMAAGGLLVLMLAQVFLVAYGASLFEDIRVLGAESESGFHLRLDYARTFVTDSMFWPFFTASGVGLGMFVWRRGLRGLYRSPAFTLIVLIAFQYVYLEFFMSLPGVVTWWKEPRYALPIVFPVLVIGSAGWAEGLRPLLAGRRLIAGAVVAAAVALLALATIPPIADEYDFYVNQDGNRVDFDQLAIADVIPDGATVYVYDDDFARPLSYRLGLAGTLYERLVSDSGRLHSRLDGNGRSNVTPGSYVVTLSREQWWPLATAPAAHWELVWQSASGVTVHHVPERLDGITPPGALVPWSVEWAVPQQHVVGEYAIATTPTTATVATLRFACGDYVSRGHPVSLPAGASAARFDVPFDIPSGYSGKCEARLTADGLERMIGTLSAPILRVLQVETVAGTGGWQPISAPFLSYGSGLVGKEGSVAQVSMAAVPGGHYRVEFLVYDYGAGVNELEVELNGVTGLVRWGDSGASPGMRRVQVLLRDVHPGGQLTFGVASVGQDALIIDALAVIDRDTPANPLVAK